MSTTQQKHSKRPPSKRHPQQERASARKTLKSMAWIGGYIVVPIILAAGILVFTSDSGQSAPVLPKEVERWRESGYTFHFRNMSVFYQDIFSMKPHRKEPVLFILHGFPTSSYDWRKVIFYLLSPFGRIIVPDMIGFGFSEKQRNRDYSVFEQADMSEELLRNLGIQEVHLLAHDLGDTVAQELMARLEDRKREKSGGLAIKSLCLTNGGILPEVHKPRLIQKICVLKEILLTKHIGDIVTFLITRGLFERSFSEVFGPDTKPTASDIDAFWSILTWDNGHRLGGRLIQYIPERTNNRDRWVNALQNTTVPLHLIYGTEDPVNPSEALQRYRTLIPKSTVDVLEGTGHYPQWENPSGFLRGYLNFTHRIGLRRYRR